jgi:hypothetical protein
MLRPIATGEIQRPDLAMALFEYNEDLAAQEYIGTQLMPFFNTPNNSGRYPVLPLDDMLRVLDTKRAVGGNYARDDSLFTFDSFQTEEDGMEASVEESEVRMYSRFFDAELLAASRARNNLLRAQEKQIADIINTPANAGINQAAAAAWNNLTNGDIKADVEDNYHAMLNTFGVRPNTLVINEQLFRTVMRSDSVRDNLKYVSLEHEVGGLSAQARLLSAYVGIDDIWIAKPLMNIADKGATANLKPIWPLETAFLMKRSMGGMELRDPSYGRTFLWTQDSPSNITIDQYPEPQTRAQIYRARHHTVPKITYKGALTRITGVYA